MAADQTSSSTTLLPSTPFDPRRPSPPSSSSHSLMPSSPSYRHPHPHPQPPPSSINAVLSPVNRPDNMDRNDKFTMPASLMSPPEPTPHDSFAQPSPGPMKNPLYSARFPMSPPVSPESKNVNPDDPASLIVTDPILYPNPDVQSASSSQPPLFVNDDTLAAQRVVDEHVAARVSSMFREASPPRHSEYELALEFKSQVAKSFNANRRLWFRREMAYLMEDKLVQSGGRRRYTAIAPATAGRPARGPATKPIARAHVEKKVRTHAPRPQVSRATPDPSKRVAREDKDFDSLPDYCPPLSSLPNRPNSLKIDWKGAPIDLRFDPHAHLLHADEVLLAANLRLDCATYLTSKRRIFIKRIEALRIGKEFRKTDAQQACKIDVNKASKLWQAFEKVGWLSPSWVRKYV